MPKNAFPMAPKSGGALPKFISGLVLVALLAMVIKQPAASAHVVSGLWSAIGSAGEALATFLQLLAA